MHSSGDVLSLDGGWMSKMSYDHLKTAFISTIQTGDRKPVQQCNLWTHNNKHTTPRSCKETGSGNAAQANAALTYEQGKEQSSHRKKCRWPELDLKELFPMWFSTKHQKLHWWWSDCQVQLSRGKILPDKSHQHLEGLPFHYWHF